MLIPRGCMTFVDRTLLFLALLCATPSLHAQSSESALAQRLNSLSSASAPQRPAQSLQIAAAIRGLPPGLRKLQLADTLSFLAIRNDPGPVALQAVADTLVQALAEYPVVSENGDQPPTPYFDLARLARYDHVRVALDNPLYNRAARSLADSDAYLQQADFTLKDLAGRDVTLSKLRGKVVLVNFWATWCGPCLLEMPDLDQVYARFHSRGLEVLAISNEDPVKVGAFVARLGFRAPVLLDPGAQTGRRLHIDSLPRTFVLDRHGKLAAVAIDQCSMRQFLQMLAAAGLHS